MSSFASVTPVGEHAMDAIAGCPERVLLALDFDGTLARIVEDPADARPHPEALSALVELSGIVGQVAIITGRDVRTAVRLGGFETIEGLEHLVVLGQYGVERWDAATGEYLIPPVVPGVEQAYRELPSVLAAAGHPTVRVEHKGRAVAVHTREQDDPLRAFCELEHPITDLAHRHGLEVEAGRMMLEMRSARCDKGRAINSLVDEVDPSIVVYCGDDLGDVPAFEALTGLREKGIIGIAVCSSAEEQPVLEELSDVVALGPDGVAEWLSTLAAVIGHTPQW